MTNEIKNVPELRFSGFKDEWRILKLGDSAIIKGRLGWKGLKQEEYVNNGHAFLVANKHINNGKVNWKKADQINQFRYEESLEIALQKGDLIFSKDGALGNPAIINELPKYATINSTMMLVRPYKEKLNSLFFYQILLSSYFNKLIHLKVSGSSIPHLFQADMKDFNFFTPKLEEQKKIGDFFSKLDRQIELEEQKLSLLEEQKKGYMQKVFSQELRFKDENGNEYPEWEDKKLLNVIAIQNGYAFKSNLFSEKGMPIIRITDINKSTVKKGTVYYPESIEINERFKIKQYDILIAMSGATTGKVGKYISEKTSLLNQRIGKFIMKKGTDNNFMFIYLNSLYFKKELSKLLVAGAQPNISSQDIENINLFIPINEEQRKIGEFFNELDELIEKQSSKIGVLKQRKKGFLQKMFV